MIGDVRSDAGARGASQDGASFPASPDAPAHSRAGTSQGDDGGRPRPLRRVPRGHRRVVREGTERFDADGVKLDPEDAVSAKARLADDDRRILGELPPHWGIFSERG